MHNETYIIKLILSINDFGLEIDIVSQIIKNIIFIFMKLESLISLEPLRQEKKLHG